MRKFSSSSKSRSVETKNERSVIDWEVRPGGLLVQRRSSCGDSSSPVNSAPSDATTTGVGPIIKIKLSFDSCYHDVTIPAQSTFGELKEVVWHKSGLEPKVQRLLFQGKEKDNNECLHMAGVKDMSKVILLEDPASKDKKMKELMKNPAYEAVSIVRAEVDKLYNKVAALETTLERGSKVDDKEFVVLTELLMLQLLKLDSIVADGEARAQRKMEVRRVQSFVDSVDNMKARCSNPFIRSPNATTMMGTKWERLESGVGSLTAPKPLQQSTTITHDWELFD
ncbi:PREDICTED: BAG family molecular chaperone regulator 4-like [Ipomoea nil]|uniref:BAG family molecular chaperone regulator 4-like n=1 Tax=Ipomoea nil TaxID=35883 RepID=UPI0009013810|nr:PREDICTED: BAG family molecular chaperone regulator 4-like [Ipomoea nil]